MMTEANTNIRSITPAEFGELCRKSSVRVIDVRTPAEFAELRLTQAKNYPLDSLNPDEFKGMNSGEELFVVCRSGGRGRKACEKLANAGVANAVNIEGGTLACDQAGLEMIRGRKTISLMRQVQITVGSIGFIGSVLAITVDSLFAGIPAFLCAGLLFAGLTDTCMLAMMLAKMPWNQRGDCTTCNVS